MNLLLFFVTVIVTFGSVVFVARIFGKEGLFAWIGLAVILANVFVCKCVDLFGLSATLGNVLFGSVFLVTDILAEKYGVAIAKKAVWVGVCSELMSLALIQIALQFVPNELDTIDASMHAVFSLFPRTTIASVTMFLLSNLLDIYIFEALKKKTKGKHLWLRNNVATIISQCIENWLFYIIAFVGLFAFKDICVMTLTCCVIEIVVAIFDTPFIYLAVGQNKEEE